MCNGQTEVRDLACPVSLDIQFFFRRPNTYVRNVNVWLKTHYRANGELRPTAPRMFCGKRPDIDNYRSKHLRIKFVLDVLQRAKILADDKHVCLVVAEKNWCLQGEERTQIELVLLE